MNPFQVNCSELVADFRIHEDKDVRNILNLLVSEYDVEIFFEIESFGQQGFYFKENRCFNIKIDDIPFNVNINCFERYEKWIVKSKDKSYLEKIIDSIGKYQIQKYDWQIIFEKN